uniref:V-type proton ATPase subunit a n=1 Tax=Macrostomum lignano TaxID=282301 RepID=A0A1I8FLE2_9PLAT
MLWRVCRGNVFLKQAEIDTALEDPATGDKVLKLRVKKICEGFRATLYPCPDSQAERREMAISVMTRIEDLNTVPQHHGGPSDASAHGRGQKNLRLWFIKVGKIKAIYHTLNMFNCLIAEAWCAVDDLDKIHLALRRGTERAGSSIPPILNRMSTRASSTRTGGVCVLPRGEPLALRHRDLPFLFAVMYGDFGARHADVPGCAVDGAAGEKQAAYCQAVRDLGHVRPPTGSVNIFGSGWSVRGQFNQSLTPDQIRTQVARHRVAPAEPPTGRPGKGLAGQPLPVRPGPGVAGVGNKITFTNSIKMKTSVVRRSSTCCLACLSAHQPPATAGHAVSLWASSCRRSCSCWGMFGYLVDPPILLQVGRYSGRNSNCAPNCSL